MHLTSFSALSKKRKCKKEKALPIIVTLYLIKPLAFVLYMINKSEYYSRQGRHSVPYVQVFGQFILLFYDIFRQLYRVIKHEKFPAFDLTARKNNKHNSNSFAFKAMTIMGLIGKSSHFCCQHCCEIINWKQFLINF